MELKEMVKPIVLGKTNSGKLLIVGVVEGVNTRSAIQTVRKLLRYEIGMLYSLWVSNIALVYGEWDMNQSSSWGIRMFPYADHRCTELQEYLNKEFMDDVCEAWLQNVACQPTHQPVDVENPEDLIELPVSEYELKSLIDSYEKATDPDVERITELKSWLNSK